MNNILHDSNLKITNLVESFLKNILKNENNDYALSNFTDDLQDKLMEFGRNIVKEVIQTVELAIFESNSRKEKYASCDVKSRKLLTLFGEVEFSRRQYYEIKNKTNTLFLTDRYLDILEKERMLKNVEENMLIEATVSSYEHAAKKAVYGEIISKQTVKNKISKLQFNVLPYKIPEQKRICSRIYIQADEDHVALQTGGICMPRIITIHEGSENGKLINPYTICGVYESAVDTLWENVLTYLENIYDYEKIEKVYILGDGANWIKTGLEWIKNSHYVSDKFHIFKAINTIAGNDSKTRWLLRSSIFKLDFEEFEANCNTIIEKENNTTKKIRSQQLLNYVLNNKTGIKRFILWDLAGCSAEGHVSHVLSDRLSSRPLGWSMQNADNMSKLRAIRANKEDIKVITRNKLNLVENERKQLEENETIRKIVNKKAKKVANYCPTFIPELMYGDKELKRKLKEIIDCKAM